MSHPRFDAKDWRHQHWETFLEKIQIAEKNFRADRDKERSLNLNERLLTLWKQAVEQANSYVEIKDKEKYQPKKITTKTTERLAFLRNNNLAIAIAERIIVNENARKNPNFLNQVKNTFNSFFALNKKSSPAKPAANTQDKKSPSRTF